MILYQPTRRGFVGGMTGGAWLGVSGGLRWRKPVPYGPRGLGFTYYDLLDQAGREDCDPKDSRCVARNVQRQTATMDLWINNYMSDPNTANRPAPDVNIRVDNSDAMLAAFMNNQPLNTATVSVNDAAPVSVAQLEAAQGWVTPTTRGPVTNAMPTTPNPPTTVAARGGQVSFQTSRGGAVAYVGDNWKVTITGASPNTSVSVQGGKGGARDIAMMGTTDSAGNFSKSGTFGAGEIGSWSETWSVGSVVSGSFSFSVQALAPGAGGQVAITSSGILPGSGSGAGTPAPAAGGFDLSSSISSMPRWVLWAGGAAVVLFAMGGGGRGR